jgi:hypothetical protein
MHNHDLGTSHPSVLGRVLDWWSDSRVRWARLQEIDLLSPDEIAWMAEDIGLASDEFLRVVREPSGLAALLERRLAALELDPEDIRKLSPLLLVDLQRTCASCTEKERCADDMAEGPNPPGWESYCPNAGTLRTLT